MPEAPGSAAAGGGAGQAANKAASRRIQSGLLERLFADNVMDLLLLLAQHSQQVRVLTVWCVAACGLLGCLGQCPCQLV